MTYSEKETIKLAGFYAVGLIVCIVVGYYSWQLARTINYNFSYSDLVTETICETVKHEHLQNPKVCE